MANIRTARRSGLVLRGGRNRRETSWIDMATTFTTLASGTPVLFSGFSASVLALRPFTIVRVRGWLSLSSDQATALENYAASFGLAIVSDQALAIGITAVPTPQAEKDSDLWFLYEELAGRIQAVTSTGISDAAPQKSIDTRAMRKVEDGQDVATVMESLSGFRGCIMSKGGRMLIKLH